MIIKVKRVDGATEMFKTDNYMLSTLKELHPAIIKAEVFTESGARVACLKRPFAFIYRHFIFKPEMLEGLTKNQEEQTEEQENK